MNGYDTKSGVNIFHKNIRPQGYNYNHLPSVQLDNRFWGKVDSLPDYYPLPFPMYINGSATPIDFLPKSIFLNAPPKSPADIFIESVNSANAVAPSDVVENDDRPRNGIKYINKTDDTIGGALSEELETWHTSSFNETFAPHPKRPSIINAPPGYGKTTFVIRELRKKAYEQGYYVLLIVNRSILKGQIARLISEGLSGHTVGDPEGSLSVYGNIVLCTYQYFMKGIDLIKRDFACLPPIEKTDVKDKINYRLIQKIGYIVMDEVHYFISDSTFGGATHDVLRNILCLSYSRFDNELLYRLPMLKNRQPDLLLL